MAATISAQAPGWFKARATNSTDGSFPSRVPTVTAPTSNDGTITIQSYPVWLAIVPYGTGSATNTFNVRVIGWRQYGSTGSTAGVLWVPTPLLEFAVTLGTTTGVAATEVLNTELFATTLGDPTTGIGNLGVNCQQITPGDNSISHYMFDTHGSSVIEVLFDMVTATSGNALVTMI